MEFADELEINLVLVAIMSIVKDQRIFQRLIFESIRNILLNLENTGGFRLKDRFTFVRLLT